jgi:hypothetical protein
MLERATIVPRFIDPPSKPRKPGGALPPWRIKDDQGNVWKVWDKDFRAFGFDPTTSIGRTYEIEYRPGEFEGKPDNQITDVKHEMQGPIPIPQVTVPPAGSHVVQHQYPNKDEIIFIENGLTAWIQKYDIVSPSPTEIAAIHQGIALALRGVYRKLVAGPTKQAAPVRPSHKDTEPELNDEFNDEIPY